MYSTELGRLPVYGQFNFSDTIAPSQRDAATQEDPGLNTSYTVPGYFSHQHLLQAHENTPLQSRTLQLEQHLGTPSAVGTSELSYSMLTPESPFTEVPMREEGQQPFTGSLLHPHMWSAHTPTSNVPGVGSLNSAPSS